MYRLSLPFFLIACKNDFALTNMDKSSGADDDEQIQAEEKDFTTAQEDSAEPEDDFDEANNEEPESEPEDLPEEEEEPPPEDDCENTSDLIYAIDKDSEVLYLYNPASSSFSSLGTLDCGI